MHLASGQYMVSFLLTSFCCWSVIFACGQEYHHSPQYQADTTAYESEMRNLLIRYKAEFDSGVPVIKKPRTHPYWDELSIESRFRRKSEGWDVRCNWANGGLEYYEHDTLKCVYAVPCDKWAIDWQREFVQRTERYRNGRISTKGEFLVLTWFHYVHQFPVNRHLLFRRDGTLKSVACFDRYGVPICDSIFDRKGHFRCVRPIDPAEVVPVK